MGRIRSSLFLPLVRGAVRPYYGATPGARSVCEALAHESGSGTPRTCAPGQSRGHSAGAVVGPLRGPHHPSLMPQRRFSAAADAALAEASPAVAIDSPMPVPDSSLDSMTPSAVVGILDRYIVGQQDAKRAVAVALRNRWRRQRIHEDLRTEVVPKNILMIGPTGCGKTEIARRLAKLADAPFVKVEATKFTEVGFHGRDVDQIIRDLTDNAIIHTRSRMKRRMATEITTAVEDKLLDLLLGDTSTPDSKDERTRDEFRELLRKGSLDERTVALEPSATKIAVGGAEALGGVSQQDFVALNKVLAGIGKAGKEGKKKMTVKEARPLIEEGEMDRMVNSETLAKEAIAAVESDGIVFIDEIDKIVTSSESRYGADASSEGVQRDLLPIIEGSTVSTKHGNVNTDFILFICSGAFHSSKPSDMMAELQGRLPIRVELKGLNAKDFYRILTEPATNMIRQQMALLATEGLELEFKDEAILRISQIAEEVNRSLDNIGARRLHTIIEKIMEDVSFRAPEIVAEAQAQGVLPRKVIEEADVEKAVGELVKRVDLSKYVL